MVKALLIDPFDKTVSLITLAGGGGYFEDDTWFKKGKKLIEADIAEIMPIVPAHDDHAAASLFMDEEALIRKQDTQQFFTLLGIYDSILAGKAFVYTHNDEGDPVDLDPRATVSWLFNRVKFLGNAQETEGFLQRGLFKRPRTVASQMGPDFQPVPGTETVLWEWSGKKEAAPAS